METQMGKFKLGRTLITPGAMEEIHPEDLMRGMQRHVRGDWGDCGTDDWALNDAAVHDGTRLLSVYHDRAGTAFWVITEADRSSTTVILPSEY